MTNNIYPVRVATTTGCCVECTTSKGVATALPCGIVHRVKGSALSVPDGLVSVTVATVHGGSPFSKMLFLQKNIGGGLIPYSSTLFGAK